MASISRSTKIGGGTTLQSNTLARAVDVETDVLALFNAHNNHNDGLSTWSVVSVSNATSVPLVADVAGGTQNILNLKNSTIRMSVSSTGEITLTGSGLGLVVTTPDGTHTYRIAISNDGELTTELVS